MDNKRIYVVLAIVGAAAAIAGILMRFWGGPPLQDAARIIGWSGIAILLVARIVFGRGRPRPPASNNAREI